MHKIIVSLALLLFASQSHAYIGPGLGAGAIAVVLGVLGSILIALFAILWYPIKRKLKTKKAAKDDNASAETSSNKEEKKETNDE